MKRYALSTAVLFALAACGGGEPAEQTGGEAATPAATPAESPAGSTALGMPEWFQHDAAANTVTITLTAGSTSDNNYWNFNGFFGGRGEIVVPAGAMVTITMVNQDPAMAHSVGVDTRTGGYPASFTNPQPAFAGAMTSNPTSLTDATLPGESETISFTASEAGEYALVCYIAGHALTGMYLRFTVSADGAAGFRS